MNKRAFLWVGSVALGLFVACSQADKHPPGLGDCDACHPPVIGTTGGDAGTTADASKESGPPEAGADATDASNDAIDLDVLIPDVGPPDAIALDGALE